MPNFDEISQSTAKIKLHPVSENGRPPYWSSLSCFDFGESVVIDNRHDILHLLAKFRSNRTISGGVMTSYRYYNMAAITLEI